MEYKDALLALIILGLVFGSILSALGMWEIRKQKKHA